MRLDNAMHDGHAQPDAFFFRREKRLEDALLLFRQRLRLILPALPGWQ